MDWNEEKIKSIFNKDYFDYRESNPIYNKWRYKIVSIYYIKCEVVKNIFNEIANFLNGCG